MPGPLFSKEDVAYLTEHWAKLWPSATEQREIAARLNRTVNSCRVKVTYIRRELGIATNANFGRTNTTRVKFTEEHLSYLLENWAKKLPGLSEQKKMAEHVGHSLFSCRSTVTRLRRQHDINLDDRDLPGEYNVRPKQEEKPYLGLLDDPEDCWWLP